MIWRICGFCREVVGRPWEMGDLEVSPEHDLGKFVESFHVQSTGP